MRRESKEAAAFAAPKTRKQRSKLSARVASMDPCAITCDPNFKFSVKLAKSFALPFRKLPGVTFNLAIDLLVGRTKSAHRAQPSVHAPEVDDIDLI